MIVNRQELIHASADALLASARKSPIPALTCVRVSASDECLMLEGTDLQHIATHAMPAQGADEWEALVVGTQLAEIITKLSGDEVRLAYAGERVVISDGRTTIKLVCRDVADWPGWTFDDASCCREVDCALPHAIGAVAHAAGADDAARVWMSGVSVFSHADETYVVATNGHRLAAHIAPGDCGKAFVVPGVAVRYMAKRVPPTTTVSVNDTTLSLCSGRLAYACKLMDVPPPDMLPVIQQARDAAHVADVDTGAAATAIRRALIMADDPHQDEVRISLGDSGIRATSESYSGSAADVVAAVAHAQTGMALNGRYLLDALASFGGLAVAMRSAGPTAPLALTTEDHVEIIMPMAR